MDCTVCGRVALTTKEATTTQVCRKCAIQCGIIPMPPVTRPPTPCARCNGRKFLHAVPREFTGRTSGELNAQMAAPMFVAYVPAVDRKDFDDANVIDTKRGFGLIEAYVCFGCGALEWFCHDVGRIPVQPNMMTEVVDFDATTPYR